VTRLIADPTAKGEHRLNYTKSTGNGKAWALKPEHEWIVNRVEPIVSAELWDTCNALLEERKVTGKRPAKRGKSAFTGFVRCHCGKKMYVPFNTPKWVCYSCRNKIPAADLDALFRDEIRGFMITPEKVSEYLASSRSGIAENQTLLEGARKEREKLKNEENRCFELYEAKALTPEQFKERYQPFHARRQELEREIPRIEAEIDVLSVEELSSEHVAMQGRNFYDDWPNLDEDTKRTVVELFLQDFVVGVEDVSVNLFSLPIFEMMTDGQRTLRGSSRRRA
jgi:site-specific DNA recombinase